MRRACELDAAITQLGVRLSDVWHQEVQDRAWPPLRVGHLVEVQTRAAAVEEHEITEREYVRQPERVAIPGLGPAERFG